MIFRRSGHYIQYRRILVYSYNSEHGPSPLLCDRKNFSVNGRVYSYLQWEEQSEFSEDIPMKTLTTLTSEGKNIMIPLIKVCREIFSVQQKLWLALGQNFLLFFYFYFGKTVEPVPSLKYKGKYKIL